MYDGQPHTVTGYDFTASNSLYTADNYSFSGTAADTTMTATNAGTQNSTLTPSMFTNTNPNFSNVEFVIVPTGMVITQNNKPIVITSGSQVFDYDGTAHSFPSYRIAKW